MKYQVPSAKSLKNQACNAISNAESYGRDVMDSMQDNVKSASESLSKITDRASVNARKWGNTAQDAMYDSRAQIQSRIKGRPITSALIAFGAGLIISKLIFTAKESDSEKE